MNAGRTVGFAVSMWASAIERRSKWSLDFNSLRAGRMGQIRIESRTLEDLL